MSEWTSTIKQGGSLALSYKTKPEQDLAGWTCRVMVKTEAEGIGGSAVIDKGITTLSGDNLALLGKLTPAETVVLAPGTYHLLGELNNVTTEENGEDHRLLVIEEQGVFDPT